MKTAVSLPDELFRRAEATARKMRISRSRLYATAIAEFIERRRTKNITERLNQLYSRESSRLDGDLEAAQVRSLDKDAW